MLWVYPLASLRLFGGAGNAAPVVRLVLPTGDLVFVVARQYGIYLQRSTAAIMASTVLSLFPITAERQQFGPL